MIETSIKTYSRAIAILLVLTIGAGWFGEMYVPSVMKTGDVASTAAQLRNNDALFRLGFAAYLVEAFSDVLLAWLFYVILRPVHRDLALLSAFFGLVSMAIFATTQLFYFSAPMFVSGSKNLAAFPPEQLDALANIFLSLYGRLGGISMLFYGTGWIIRGYLTFRSGYLPRFLGVLMLVAGFGFFTKTVTYILAPSLSSDLLLAPMFLTAVAVAIWMAIKGIDPEGWKRANERPRESWPRRSDHE